MNLLQLFAIIYSIFMVIVVGVFTYELTKKPNIIAIQKPSQITCVVELHQENELHEWHGVVK